MNFRQLLIVVFLTAILTGASFQVKGQKEIASQNNSWLMFFGNHRISSKWGIHTEYQFRRSEWLGDWQQSLLRVGADYYSSENSMITGGYAWIRSFPYGEQPIDYAFNEHRIWQQLVLTQNTGRLYFHHRYRLEQRFLEKKNVNFMGNYDFSEFVFRQRARYRVFVSIPLNHPRMVDKTWFLGLYDEVFLGFGKGIKKNILDQNRLYAALGYRVNKNKNFQMGYLNHFVVKSDGVQAERNHTFQLSMQYNLDLR